jgi:hypothetical protein
VGHVVGPLLGLGACQVSPKVLVPFAIHKNFLEFFLKFIELRKVSEIAKYKKEDFIPSMIK